jgi:hypothetical protein
VRSLIASRAIISLQTSYRLDNRNCAGDAKDSDKQEVALHRRQTTTKRSQRGERGQLPHPWVHLQDTFHFALFWRRPDPPDDAATGRDLPRPGGRSWPPTPTLAAWFGEI